jgi:AcrR family transcriptional regulator
MDDVAARCGVTKLIVYRHFASKEDLYRAILQHVFEHLGQAAREPQFAAYASELRAISVDVVRRLTGLDSGDALFDAWRAEALFGWLVEATLTWLERGDAARDEEFVLEASAGLRALRDALTLTRT